MFARLPLKYEAWTSRTGIGALPAHGSSFHGHLPRQGSVTPADGVSGPFGLSGGILPLVAGGAALWFLCRRRRR